MWLEAPDHYTIAKAWSAWILEPSSKLKHRGLHLGIAQSQEKEGRYNSRTPDPSSHPMVSTSRAVMHGMTQRSTAQSRTACQSTLCSATLRLLKHMVDKEKLQRQPCPPPLLRHLLLALHPSALIADERHSQVRDNKRHSPGQQPLEPSWHCKPSSAAPAPEWLPPSAGPSAHPPAPATTPPGPPPAPPAPHDSLAETSAPAPAPVSRDTSQSSVLGTPAEVSTPFFESLKFTLHLREFGQYAAREAKEECFGQPTRGITCANSWQHFHLTTTRFKSPRRSCQLSRQRACCVSTRCECFCCNESKSSTFQNQKLYKKHRWCRPNPCWALSTWPAAAKLSQTASSSSRQATTSQPEHQHASHAPSRTR